MRGHKYTKAMKADGSAGVRVYKYGNTSPTRDGTPMFNLANKHCPQFGTCNENAYSHVNENLMVLLLTGKDAVRAKDCNNLPLDRSDELFQIPLMQAIFRYAIKCESLEADKQSKDLAEGEVFAMSVLPAICAGEWKSFFDSMFHGGWRRLIFVCSICVFLLAR